MMKALRRQKEEFVIAAQACLLLLHRDTDYYPDLQSILVYPGTYYSRVTEEDEKESRGFAGQSWQRGPLILAWDAVQGGVSNRSDGQNVVFHEFAHRLDNEDDRIDGLLSRATEAACWDQAAWWGLLALRIQTSTNRQFAEELAGLALQV